MGTQPQRIISRVTLLFTCVFTLMIMASVSAAGASVAQGFKTSMADPPAGALMAPPQDAPDTEEWATPQRAERLAGVSSNNPLISVSDSTSNVQVITQGTAPTLVTNMNGEIKTGDPIAVSSIEGVGMKAIESGVIVGIAETDFDSASATERVIANADGSPRTVRVGVVAVRGGVVAYITGKQSTAIPSLLQDFANNVAGRQVSVVRVLFATLLLLLLFATVTVLLYGAVHSSIISIGRNPLSEAILRKSLSQVGWLVGVITTVGLISTYLILRV